MTRAALPNRIRTPVGDVLVPAHRLAWFYAYGVWPQDQIDHRNGIRSDNRICNLREATNSLNKANERRRTDNTSGFKGVHRRENGRWRARIGVGNRRLALGDFDTPEAAHTAYCQAAAQHFGEFARAE